MRILVTGGAGFIGSHHVRTVNRAWWEPLEVSAATALGKADPGDAEA